MEAIFIVGIWLLLCFLVDKYAVTQKGRSGFFVISFLLSPLVGFLIALLVGKNERKAASLSGGKICPACAETVKAAAAVCRFCGHQFSRGPASSSVTPRTDDPLGIHKTRRAKAVRFFYAENGTQEGPFTAEEIADFIDAGVISEQTPVFREGDTEWRLPAAYPEIAT